MVMERHALVPLEGEKQSCLETFYIEERGRVCGGWVGAVEKVEGRRKGEVAERCGGGRKEEGRQRGKEHERVREVHGGEAFLACFLSDSKKRQTESQIFLASFQPRVYPGPFF